MAHYQPEYRNQVQARLDKQVSCWRVESGDYKYIIIIIYRIKILKHYLGPVASPSKKDCKPGRNSSWSTLSYSALHRGCVELRKCLQRSPS